MVLPLLLAAGAVAGAGAMKGRTRFEDGVDPDDPFGAVQRVRDLESIADRASRLT